MSKVQDSFLNDDIKIIYFLFLKENCSKLLLILLFTDSNSKEFNVFYSILLNFFLYPSIYI